MELRKPLIFLLTILFVFGTKGLLYAQNTGEGDGEQNRFHEHTIDSAMALSPKFMPVFTAQLPGTYFNPLIYTPVDTSIFHTSQSDPLLRPENIYQSLGIFSQAHKSMLFDYGHEIGFSMLTLPYPLYFKQQKDLKFYDVQTSFTNIAYTFGISFENSSATENRIQATHAQKIKQFEFIFDINGYNNKGYFLHQGTNMFNLDIIAHYATPKNRYGFIASYILNHGKYAENGGLEDYLLFLNRGNDLESSSNDLGSYGVVFNNAVSELFTHDLLFQQYVNLKDKKDRYYGTLSHTFQFKYNTSAFTDHNLNNDFYRDRYYISADSTNDSLRYYSIINTLQWSNYEPLSKQSENPYSFRIAAGVRHEYVHSLMPFYSGNNFSLFARTNIRLFKVWDIYGNISYSFNNYNQNDAIANTAATFSINRKQKHFIGLGADFYRVSPDFLYTYYYGNNNKWYLTLKKENNLKLSAFWTIFDYKLSFNYFMMSHHVYLNSDFEPEVSDKSINIVQLSAFAPLRIHNFYMDLNLTLQHSTDDAIAVPLFAGKLHAAYCFRIFKNRLRLQVGADMMYNTAYYADGYNPLLHQFYHQDETKVGNFIYFDAHVTLLVERLAFFVRVNNLFEGLFGQIKYNYFTTPYYPMQGRNISLGVSWRFYD